MWAGISWVGATDVLIFDGLLDAEGYVDVLQTGLLPFIRENLATHHRLMQDNNPKHISRRVRGFMEEEGINLVENTCRKP